MSQGPIWRKLAAFAIPLLIGNVVQQLYNTVDSIVVGQVEGDEALAAVGASGPLMFLLLVLFMGVATGAGIMVAQYYGAKDRDSLSRTIGTTLTLMLIVSLLIMAVTPFVVRPLLSLMQTPSNVIDACASYLTIIFMGITGIAFYNGISGVLRGMGDSLMPLVYLTVTCGMNIVLDIWFVAGLGWGISGAAWATVISQWVSSALCLRRLVKLRDGYEVTRATLRLDKDLCKKIARLGLPAAATQTVFSLAGLLVQSLTNSFGSNVIACFTIVQRVDAFAVMPVFSFGMAMSTFVGQNVGAGRYDRVDKGIKSGLIMGASVTAALIAAMLLFGKPLMGIFSETQSVIDLSYRMLAILSPGYLAFAFTQIMFGVMRGAGDTMSSMWISVATTVAVRTPLAYLFAWITRTPEQPLGSPESIMTSLLAAWTINAVLAGFALRAGGWRKKRVAGDVAGGAAVSDAEESDEVASGAAVRGVAGSGAVASGAATIRAESGNATARGAAAKSVAAKSLLARDSAMGGAEESGDDAPNGADILEAELRMLADATPELDRIAAAQQSWLSKTELKMAASE